MKIFLLCVRLSMALVWLYNGLWLKIVVRDEHHRAIIGLCSEAIGGLTLASS